MWLTQKQYEVIKAVVLMVFGTEGPWDVEQLKAEIDKRVEAGEIAPVFTRSSEEVWENYRNELLRLFFMRWEEERYKTEQRRIIGVSRYAERMKYELLNGNPSDAARAAALAYYRQGLTMIVRFALDKPLEDVLTDVVAAVQKDAEVKQVAQLIQS